MLRLQQICPNHISSHRQRHRLLTTLAKEMRYYLKITGRSKRTRGRWSISGFSTHMLMEELCGVYLIEAVRVETAENLLLLCIVWVSMERWALSGDPFKEGYMRKIVPWSSGRNMGLGKVGGCIWRGIWGMLCGNRKGKKTELMSPWISLIAIMIIAHIHRVSVTFTLFNHLT